MDFLLDLNYQMTAHWHCESRSLSLSLHEIISFKRISLVLWAVNNPIAKAAESSLPFCACLPPLSQEHS